MNNYLNNQSLPNVYDPYQGFIHGNMFPNTYSPYLINPLELQATNEQEQMLNVVNILTFAALDLHLYLDTHPDDQGMIQLFNQYRVGAKQATDEYEKKYGPLNMSSDSLNAYPWAWIKEPWPWDK